MDRNQNGFRRGRSCTDNLVRFTTDIELSRKLNRNTLAAFLDVNSAYDNVRANVLCDILREKKCPSKIVRYIDSWMRNRITKFVLGDDLIETRLVNKDLP